MRHGHDMGIRLYCTGGALDSRRCSVANTCFFVLCARSHSCGDPSPRALNAVICVAYPIHALALLLALQVLIIIRRRRAHEVCSARGFIWHHVAGFLGGIVRDKLADHARADIWKIGIQRHAIRRHDFPCYIRKHLVIVWPPPVQVLRTIVIELRPPTSERRLARGVVAPHGHGGRERHERGH